MTRSETFPAGTYYVGDLGYVFGEEKWTEICDAPGSFDGLCELPDGTKMYMFNTGGDGTFEDTQGREYSVDTGSLGIVNTDYIPKNLMKNAEELGHIVKFGVPFMCWRDEDHEDMIHFGYEVTFDMNGPMYEDCKYCGDTDCDGTMCEQEEEDYDY